MKPVLPFLTTSRVFLAAAVLSTAVTGCGRHNADTPTAGAGSADSGATASAGMGKDASTTAASKTGSTGNTLADSTAAASPAPTGMTPATSDTAASGANSSSGASGTTGNNAAGAPAATPNDAQIAAIVMTANDGEIAAGKIAESKAQNAKVKAFARDMIKDHTAMNQQGDALAKKKHLTPEENDVTKSLKDDTAKQAATLKAASGAAFDKAYIDSQVTDHEKVLMMIDNVLLPNAKDADLKAMLQKARPQVNMHLDHAKALQASMK